MGVGEKIGQGASIVAKVLVSLLWLGIAIALFATGVWYGGLLAIAYLVYLWVFGGRWLIY